VTELPKERTCPVCEAPGKLVFFQIVDGVSYCRCLICMATLMEPEHWPGPEQEREVYALHDNDPDDPGYRRFLSKVAAPLTERLEAGLSGLDFGCGPGPALARIMEEAGMQMNLYDPLFAPDTSVLERTYDFVTCTEVVEHLRQPASVFRQLDGLLEPGGWLAVMTCFQTDDSRFARWHYRRDPTHIVFYREETLACIAGQIGWELEVPVKDVALFRKPKKSLFG
jgi:SAM-dependent methyltransferase